MEPLLSLNREAFLFISTCLTSMKERERERELAVCYATAVHAAIAGHYRSHPHSAASHPQLSPPFVAYFIW